MVGTLVFKRVSRKNTIRVNALLAMVIILVFIVLYVFNKIPSTVLGTLPGFKDTTPKFAYMIYGQFGDLQFNKPMDVWAANDKVYVTDSNNQRVQVFDTQGKFLFTFGKKGLGKGEFQFPYGIAVDGQGHVYVGDLRRGNIAVFTGDGKYIGDAIKTKSKLLDGPGDIFIKNKRLYITDINDNKVLVFDMKTKKCELEIKTKKSELKAPNGITVDDDGNMYVVDTGHDRVIVIDAKGKFVRVFNGSKDGTGSTVLANPRGIAIDSLGRIMVVSNLTNTVYGFDETGLNTFNFGGLGSLNNQFSLPNGLFIDQNNRIYVTDTSNQRVAVYQ